MIVLYFSGGGGGTSDVNDYEGNDTDNNFHDRSEDRV